MKSLIRLIKYFNKRELEVLYTECKARAKIDSQNVIIAQGNEKDFYRGRSCAYERMARRIDEIIKEER